MYYLFKTPDFLCLTFVTAQRQAYLTKDTNRSCEPTDSKGERLLGLRRIELILEVSLSWLPSIIELMSLDSPHMIEDFRSTALILHDQQVDADKLKRGFT